MDPRGRIAVVTGAAGGIGGALVRALVAAGAETVVAVDLRTDDIPTGDRVVARGLDVGDDAATARWSRRSPPPTGRSTCGSPTPAWPAAAGDDAPDETWALQWQVNVMSHVYAARALLPGWIARGEGHLITTASMAGILTSLGDGVYAATKHAAVGFAEWLAITHGDDGVKVSCICPGAVDTAMLRGGAGGDAGEGGGRDRRRRGAAARRGRGPGRSPPSPRTASSSTPTPTSRSTSSARPPTPSAGSAG